MFFFWLWDTSNIPSKSGRISTYPMTRAETLNTAKQEPPNQIETRNNENRNTTNPNTTKQTSTHTHTHTQNECSVKESHDWKEDYITN